MMVPDRQVYGLPPGLPGARFPFPKTQMFGLPPGLPGARPYWTGEQMFGRWPGLGQQVTPRGFGQQMAASGRAFAYGGGGGGMFGLGQDADTGAKSETNWLTIVLGVTTAVAAVGLVLCLTGKKGGTRGALTLGETPAARAYISKQTRKLIREGYVPKRAVAASYSMARRRGYKVPRKPR